LSAKQATSFVIKFEYFCHGSNVQSLTNEETNEKMVIKQKEGYCRGSRRVKISRYPMAAKKEWNAEMAKYQHGYHNITIDFSSS
jgi:hypothetical protein